LLGAGAGAGAGAGFGFGLTNVVVVAPTGLVVVTATDVPAGVSAIAKTATMVPRPIRDMNTG
jgi:hypothetical protein